MLLIKSVPRGVPRNYLSYICVFLKSHVNGKISLLPQKHGS